MAGTLQTTFPTSSVEGSTSCVNIGILQNLAVEGNHSFGVEVISATPSVVVVGTPSEETVTILDDESMYIINYRNVYVTHIACYKCYNHPRIMKFN